MSTAIVTTHPSLVVDHLSQGSNREIVHDFFACNVVAFEHETADILDLLRQSFLLNDSLLDYELLWTLTNLTAILQPKEIELLFGPASGSKNQNAAKFIIQKLTSIIASSDDGQCKRLPLCCLACWAIGNILGPVSFKITVWNNFWSRN